MYKISVSEIINNIPTLEQTSIIINKSKEIFWRVERDI